MEETVVKVRIPAADFVESSVQPSGVSEGVVVGDIFGIPTGENLPGGCPVDDVATDDNGGSTIGGFIKEHQALITVLSTILVFVVIAIVLVEIGVGQEALAKVADKNIPIVSKLCDRLSMGGSLLRRKRKTCVIVTQDNGLVSADSLYRYMLRYQKIEVDGVLVPISDFDFYAVPSFVINGRRYFVRLLDFAGVYHAISAQDDLELRFTTLSTTEVALLGLKEAS